MPEAYVADAPTDDERYYVPLTETVGIRPLWISPTPEPLVRHPVARPARAS